MEFEFAKQDIRVMDIIVGIQNVTNSEFRVVALFNSVINANPYAKSISAVNPDRRVIVFTQDYARIWVNGEIERMN